MVFSCAIRKLLSIQDVKTIISQNKVTTFDIVLKYNNSVIIIKFKIFTNYKNRININ